MYDVQCAMCRTMCETMCGMLDVTVSVSSSASLSSPDNNSLWPNLIIHSTIHPPIHPHPKQTHFLDAIAVYPRQGPHLSIRIVIWILPSWTGRGQCYLVYPCEWVGQSVSQCSDSFRFWRYLSHLPSLRACSLSRRQTNKIHFHSDTSPPPHHSPTRSTIFSIFPPQSS